MRPEPDMTLGKERVRMGDSWGQLGPAGGDEVRDVLDAALRDAGTGWSAGVFGALAEFMYDPDEAVSVGHQAGCIVARTARGGLRITTGHPHARLLACDPETASSLNPTDPQRVIRAMEVFEATGRSIRSFQGPRHGAVVDPARSLAVFLEPDRDVLRARIDARFEQMMRQGALEEVEALASLGLDPALPVMRAHGVPGLMAALRGELSMDQAIDKGKADTRRYAKRQHTWFRHQAPDFIWMTPDGAQVRIESLLETVPSPQQAWTAPHKDP
jgi:hypothetical protein